MKAIIKRFVREESGATAIGVWPHRCWHCRSDYRRRAGNRCKPERHVYGRLNRDQINRS